MNYLKQLKLDKRLLLKMIQNDFKTRYLGSYLGVFWALINPIVTVLTYWFVFEVGFRNGPVNDIPFVLWLVPGIIPWFYFSDSIGAATTSVIDNSYLVKKVRFRVGYLPLIKICSSLIIHLFFLLLTIGLFVAHGYYPTLYYFDLLFYLVTSTLLIVGLAYITSSLNVFFKDINQIVGIILQFGFWLTPIFWNPEIISDKYSFIFKLNPMYYVTSGYRNTFIYGHHFWEDSTSSVFYIVQIIVVLLIGLVFFKRSKNGFSDVL
ncbi:ABC transporter permease [Paenibacillus pseudetheri]|uniref:Transport permease protein n=1 Tax=Paenibacillus pseudetheri TaxID=2897682 RepID=A0ABM9BL86_9BACL|nr:ABC transporter permease [Paenibacillus pseudetheri]CAH1059492.1 Teichoic acid translocation permease protein TagG [Paenibacillus pseudetheri]